MPGDADSVRFARYLSALSHAEGQRDFLSAIAAAARASGVAPIAASLAAKLELNVDAFLMAVAVGAACDVLTPFGHQCNTLVLGPGGYRCGDYWKLGLPLSLMGIAAGVPLIAWVWDL